MKVYVVVTDPNYYCHYDSVWLSEESARAYILDCERASKEGSRLYGEEFFKRGVWTKKQIDDLGKMAQMWGYPGHGYSHGIIEEEIE